MGGCGGLSQDKRDSGKESNMVQAIANCLVITRVPVLNCCMEPISDSQSPQVAVLSGRRKP